MIKYSIIKQKKTIILKYYHCEILIYSQFFSIKNMRKLKKLYLQPRSVLLHSFLEDHFDLLDTHSTNSFAINPRRPRKSKSLH